MTKGLMSILLHFKFGYLAFIWNLSFGIWHYGLDPSCGESLGFSALELENEREVVSSTTRSR